MKFLMYLCLLLAGSLLPLCPAAGENDEDDGGGAVLDAALQWQLADSSYQKRQYEDAAALFANFTTANPDHANALEAYWRVYIIYTANRPNPERRKKAYESATVACEHWERQYAEKDKLRLAQSLWYRALLQDRQSDRPGGIRFLQELLKRAEGTTLDSDVYWTLAEWLYQAKRYQDAVPHYSSYRQKKEWSDQAALSCYREARCHIELKDSASAVAAYKGVLEGKYNWRAGHLYNNALDAAAQLRALGEEELARSFAMKLLDKGPQIETLQKSARLFLGETISKRILIAPELYSVYSTGNINVDGRTKFERTIDLQLVVRPSFVTKEDPFEGVLKVIPRQATAKLPENMKAVDEAGAKAYTAEIKVPDANGKVPGEFRYKFLGGAVAAETASDGLAVTRKWEKTGNTWGQSTIRIQTTARWDLWLTLPNNKTNPNNINPRPYSVSTDGKTFHWPYWCYDPTQGFTIKFPVEVGEKIQDYYPALSLARNMTPPYKDGHTDVAAPEFDCRWFAVSVTSPKEFPCSFFGPARMTIALQEVVK